MKTRKLKYDRDALINDWVSGKFTQAELAKLHGMSRSSVQRILAGTPPGAPGSALGSEPPGGGAVGGERNGGGQCGCGQNKKHGMTRAERARYVRFFNSAGLLVARAAVQRVKATPDLSMVEMRQASDIVSGQRAGILGKLPDTAIQINNNTAAAKAGEGTPSLEEYKQERAKIVGEF